MELDLVSRDDIGPTEKDQLVKSRRGQGLFRARVALVENGCRVTGVSEKTHLRASHIKPWKNSSDLEKLDGYNGLLLAPHVDHLFDRGYISFEDSGELITSPALTSGILASWGMPITQNVGGFAPSQCKYLEWRRRNVLQW